MMGSGKAQLTFFGMDQCFVGGAFEELTLDLELVVGGIGVE
jgi:hypothetical protein